MKKQLYFDTDGEYAYDRQYWLEYMQENNLDEIRLFEAVPEYGTGYFWCGEYFEVGEVGEGCGKACEAYSPRNGKNGRCRFSNHLYSPGKEIILKLRN